MKAGFDFEISNLPEMLSLILFFEYCKKKKNLKKIIFFKKKIIKVYHLNVSFVLSVKGIFFIVLGNLVSTLICFIFSKSST